MIAPMPAAAADWIYREVLTAAYRRAVGAEAKGEDAGVVTGPAVLRMCPCQWGTCHGCLTGHHAGCVRDRIVTAAAYVIGTRGDVVTVPRDGSHAVHAAVWLFSRQCAWQCPCDCPAPEPEMRPALFDAVPVEVKRHGQPETKRHREMFGQGSLFDLAGGAR